MTHKKEELRGQLRELSDASSLLTDDRIYTAESYRNLVRAIAFAKVTLSKEASDEAELFDALCGLNDAIDGLVLKPEAEKPTQTAVKKALPYLLCGALVCGVLLGKKMEKKKNTRSRK